MPTPLCPGRVASLRQAFPPEPSFSKMVASALPASVLQGASGRLLQVPPSGSTLFAA